MTAVWIKWSEDGKKVVGAAPESRMLGEDGKIEQVPWFEKQLRKSTINFALAKEVMEQIG